jgi:hypothetical protein
VGYIIIPLISYIITSKQASNNPEDLIFLKAHKSSHIKLPIHPIEATYTAGTSAFSFLFDDPNKHHPIIMPSPPSSDGLNNRFNSYQQSGSYVPPGRTLADQQTNTLSDTVKTQYEAESTANAVLSQLHGQREQFQGANNDVWDMRKATEQTKRELESLRSKHLEKKRRLYGIISMLAAVDLLLFYRIISCRGGFFC